MSIRILVVDDNPDILANVRDFLSMKDGWAPETASTGLEALERIDRSTFDLVILDVGLPDTDGMTLTRRLRASGFTAPILMLTARIRRGTSLRARSRLTSKRFASSAKAVTSGSTRPACSSFASSCSRVPASSRAVDSRRSSGRASRPPPTACARTFIFCARRSTSRSTIRSSTRILASAGPLPIFPTPFPEAPPCPSAIRLRAALPSASC